MRKYRNQLISWSLTALFLFLVLRQLDWGEFVQGLARVSPTDILLLTGCYLFGFLLRGLRCQLLLPGLGFTQATLVVTLGYAANNLLPARLGEFVRAYYGAKKADVPVPFSLSTVFLERVLDGFVIVLLLLAGTQSLALPKWVEHFRLGGLLLFSLLLFGLMVAGLLARRIEPYLPANAIGRKISELLGGISRVARSPLLLLLLLVTSVSVWFVEGGMFYLGGGIFGFDLTLSQALFVLGVVNLGVLIPSSPGNLGVFQYFATLALGVLGANPSDAAAYAVVVHACQYLPITLIGLFYWGGSTGRAGKLAEEAIAAAPVQNA